MDAPICHLF